MSTQLTEFEQYLTELFGIDKLKGSKIFKRECLRNKLATTLDVSTKFAKVFLESPERLSGEQILLLCTVFNISSLEFAEKFVPDFKNSVSIAQYQIMEKQSKKFNTVTNDTL